MANIIKPKRSNVTNNVPTTGNLTSGEIGVNMADKKIYINNGTSIVQIGSGEFKGLSDVSSSLDPGGFLKLGFDGMLTTTTSIVASSLSGPIPNSIPYQLNPNSTAFISAPTEARSYLSFVDDIFAWSPSIKLSGGKSTPGGAPLTITGIGTLLTDPEAGAVEHDGVVKYFTPDTTTGRGYIPSKRIFRLATAGSAIGPGINNFFGANSAAQLKAGEEYELIAYLYFTKNTAGTVTFTLTSSVAPVGINAELRYGVAAGGTAFSATTRSVMVNNTLTAAAFPASVSLTNNTNHLFVLHAIIDANASSTSNIRINVTSSAGTVTPGARSYYTITKLPSGNTGAFVA